MFPEAPLLMVECLQELIYYRTSSQSTSPSSLYLVWAHNTSHNLSTLLVHVELKNLQDKGVAFFGTPKERKLSLQRATLRFACVRYRSARSCRRECESLAVGRDSIEISENRFSECMAFLVCCRTFSLKFKPSVLSSVA